MVDESIPRATSNKEEKRREVTGQHTALGPMRLQEEETAYVDELLLQSKQRKEMKEKKVEFLFISPSKGCVSD